MTDVSLRQTVSDGNSGAAASVSIGAGTAVNDVLIAIGTSDFYTFGAFGPPSGGGWMPITDVDRGASDSKLRAWWKPVTTGGSATITLAPIIDEEVGLTVLVLENASTVAPIDCWSSNISAIATPSLHTALSITTRIAQAFLIAAACVSTFNGGGTYTPPSGMTERADVDLPTSAGHWSVATQQMTTAGATGTRSFTYSENGDAGAAIMFAVRPADFTPPADPYFVATRAATQQLTAATSTAVDMPAAGNIATGNVLIARWAGDNSGTNGAATTVSVTDPRSNTWTVGAAANQDPGAANEGVSARIAYAVATNAYTNGDDLTLNYGNSTTADSVVVDEWAGLDTGSLVAVAQATATGVSATPSVGITPTATGQLVVAMLGIEGPGGDVYTADTDTTNGEWYGLPALSTTSATATSNQTVRGAYKIVTGTSAQTFNPAITSRDWAAVIIVFNVATSGGPVVLEGQADSISEAGGTLQSTRTLAATTDSISNAGGSLQSTLALSGTTDSISEAGGTLQRSVELASTTDSISDASGTIQRAVELASTADSISDATGTVERLRALESTTDSISDATGSLQSTLELEGAAESISEAGGTLARTRELAGEADSISDAAGTITGPLALEGSGDAVSTTEADLSISGQVDLAAIVDSISDASGTLELEQALAGVGDSISDAAGTLTRTLNLGGTTDAAGGAEGDVTIRVPVELAGTADAINEAEGDLSVQGLVDLAGNADAASSASGQLTGTTQFEGAADAVASASGQLTITGEVKRDTMVLPLAEDLLACLCEAVAEGPNPPASCCLRPGTNVAQGVSEFEDECCEGLAWVRVVRVFPSGGDIGFPEVNQATTACSPPSYGIELEMGIYRCAPTGDATNLPTCDEWTAATEQVLHDAASMRRAWCCFRDNHANDAKLVNQWIPVNVQGGCTGGTISILIESYCADCNGGGAS